MKIYITIILIHLCLLGNASNHRVQGKLKDAATSSPVEFATIAVRNFESNNLISSMITDSKGEFLFTIKPGTYKMEIRCLGYTEVIKRLDVEKMDVYLNTINMKVDTKQLNEVSVTASNIIEKHDRDIHTITKQFKEGTNTVKDLLTKIRGINVDPLDNSIRVNNDNNVLLLVDGVKKNQKYIKNISPERIIRIEIINNPTGRFLTEGYSSVINIIAKKDFCGHELYVEEKGLYSLNKSNGDDILFSNRANINYTYTYKQLNIYGSYINTKSNTNLLSTNDKWLGKSGLLKRSNNDKPNSIRDGLSNNILLGTDIFINNRHSISLETNIVNSPFDQNSTNKIYNNTIIAEDGIQEDYISQLNINQFNRATYSLLAYRFNISKKSKLEFDYGFNDVNNKILNSYSENNTNNIDQNIEKHQTTSKSELNYKYFFSSKSVLNIGLRNTFRNTRNKYLLEEGITENKNIKDNRNTMFTYFSFTPKGKLKTRIGLAVEQNTLKSGNTTHNYYSLQPYLNMNYKWSNSFNITLKLNSNSNYPYADQVNPFEQTIDRITTIKGNPSLSYATNYNTSLELKLFKNKLCIEPFYKISEDFISKTGSIVNNKFRHTYSNLDRYESIGVNLSTKLTVIPRKMFINFTGTLYSDNTRFNGYNNHITDFSINSNIMYLSSRYKTLCALILKRMNSKHIQAYGYNNNNNDYLGLLLKQPFLKNKLAVTMLYILPVSSGLNYSMDEKIEYSSFSEDTKTDVSMLKNLFMLKITYSLNKGNKVNTIKKKNFKDITPSKGFF